MSKISKSLFIFTLLFGGFLLVGAGCNFAQSNLPPIQPLPPEVNNPPSTSTNSTDTGSTTTSLKTFSSDIAGFELQYPEKLNVESSYNPTLLTLAFPQSDTVNTPLTDTKITVEFNQLKTLTGCIVNYTNVQNVIKNSPSDSNGALTEMVVKNDLTFYGSEIQSAGAGNMFYTATYELFTNQKCYRLTLGLQSPLDINSTKTGTQFNRQPFIDTFEQIVSSFKLTNSSSTPITSASSTAQNLVITLNDNNKTFNLKVGDSFLVNLGDQMYAWIIAPNNSTVISRGKNVMVIKGAQGLYKASQPGETDLLLKGEPLACLSLKTPTACNIAPLTFKIHIVVK